MNRIEMGKAAEKPKAYKIRFVWRRSLRQIAGRVGVNGGLFSPLTGHFCSIVIKSVGINVVIVSLGISIFGLQI